MKNNNPQDERIAAQRRKINSEGYSILMIALMGSMLIQQFALKAPFEQYAAEFICFFGMSVYVVVRYMMFGLNLYGEGKRAKKISLLNSMVTGAVATAVNSVINYTKYAEHYKDNIGFFIAGQAIFFISVTASVFAVLWFLNYLNDKRQAKIRKKLDEDEISE